MTECRKCRCGFDGQSGDHEYFLCNMCIISLADDAAARLTSGGEPHDFAEQYKSVEPWWKENYRQLMAFREAAKPLLRKEGLKA